MKDILIKIVVFLIISVTTNSAQAEEKYNWQMFTAATSFTKICKVSNEYWVGHSGGISILDNSGTLLKQINKANSGLPVNFITDLDVDSTGTVWIGTTEGLVKFADNEWTQFYNKNSLLVNNNIKSVKVDNEGRIWIATDGVNNNLFYIYADTWTSLNSINGFIRKILVDKENSVYVFSSGAIYKSNDNTFDKINTSKLFTNDYTELLDACIDKDNSLWVTLRVGYVASYSDSDGWEIWDSTQVPFDKYDKNIFCDSNNDIWVADNELGLYKLEDDKWIPFTNPDNGEIMKAITSFYSFDNGHDYFLGSNGFGFYKLSSGSLSELNLNTSGMKFNNCSSLALSPGGELFVANRKSIFEFDSIVNSNVIADVEWVNEMIFDIYSNLWIASAKGLFCLSSDNQLHHFFTTACYCVETDPNGIVWAGTSSRGVFKIDSFSELLNNNKYQLISSQNSDLPHNAVSTIEYDKSTGDLWFGCNWYGWARLRGNQWTVFTVDNTPVTYQEITKIKADKVGDVWVSSLNELFVFSGNQWFKKLDSGVGDIEIDKNGNVWVSVSDYLYKFHQDSVNEFHSRSYPLPAGSQKDLLVDNDNNLWIGGNDGLVKVALGSFTDSSSNESNSTPIDYRLSQNYPNPFNTTTTIEYSIPELSNVRIDVFNMLGQKITTLVNEQKLVGNYRVQFDGGQNSSGVYFYKISADNYKETRKMILTR